MWIIGVATGVDLLAQVGDVELHHVGLAAEVVVPDPVEDLGLAEHAAWVAHQEAQQLELGRGQTDLLAAPAHLVAVLVEHEVADVQRRLALRLARPGTSHQRSQPGHDLLQRERLGDVVVAARGEAGDAVLDGVAGGQEEHGYVGLVATQPAEHLHAVEVGQHHVEHDGVGALPLRGATPPWCR